MYTNYFVLLYSGYSNTQFLKEAIYMLDKLDKFYPLCYAMHNTLYIEDIEERGGSFDDHDAGDCLRGPYSASLIVR